MRRRKHFMTLVCLIVGMLVLTTTVYANYDNAKGYTSYKNALKQVAFEADNFTAEYDSKITIDGKEMLSLIGNYKCADGNNSQYSKDENSFGEKNYVSENYSYKNGGYSYYYYVDDNLYYKNKITSENENGSLIPLDDATSKKAVRFAELLTDTIVGDLKNNIVLESSKDGINNYSINVSGNQIPEIVNAGLSLMFTANNSDDYQNEIIAKFGKDANVDKVNFKVSLDEKGRLVENNIEATLLGIDKDGNQHTATLQVNGKISEYEKTKVDVFNAEGKKLMNPNDDMKIGE